MIVIYFLTGLLILSYMGLIFSFIRGWKNLPSSRFTGRNNTTISVIIPFRNEARNIPSLLKSLKCQDYTAEKWNIIFIDDHSTDGSCEILSTEIKDFKAASLLSLPGEINGKKGALEYGARRSNAELLLFTDADCLPCHTWISEIAACYEMNHPVLISAPVVMESGRSFFSKFQALEFMSLFAAGAASFGKGNPILINGANLAIRRDIYTQNLRERKNNISSGDDIFMLLSLKKIYLRELMFLKSRDAFVKVFPMPDPGSFLSQRMRWTSKARHYRDRSIIVTALLVFLLNLVLSTFFIYGIFVPRFFLFWGVIFILKSAADYTFLREVAIFTGQRSLLKFFALSQSVYFLYIGFIGMIGNFTSNQWKGRKINI